MAGFEAITTQEQLDAVIKDRLERERKTLTEKYSDYDDLKEKVSDYEKQIGDLNKSIKDNEKKYADYDQQLSALQTKVKGYESDSVKTRIAHEAGIPYELASRLTGEDENSIRKDAETVAKLFKTGQQPAPLKSTEPGDVDGKRAAMKNVLAGLKGED